MARLNVTISFPWITLPLVAWPALDRLAGSGTNQAAFEILGGPLAGGRILLGGSGFTYDAEEMPATGTVTSITLQRPGDFATLSILDAVAVPAAALRASTDLTALLLAGADTLTGGTGGDRLRAGEGNDLLEGGAGADRLDAGGGRDTLNGGAGADMLLGGAGDDVLTGGAGRDVLRAGAGDDVVVIAAEGDAIRGELVDGGAGFDTLRFDAPDEDYVALDALRLAGIEALHVVSPLLLAMTAEQMELIELVRLDWDPVATGKGRLEIDGNGGGIFALDAFDVAAPAVQGISLYLNAGSTVFGRNLAQGLADDLVGGSTGWDWMYLGEGDDTATGRLGADNLLGEDGDDSLDGGEGNDTVRGGADQDTMEGGEGDDFMLGEAGQDTMEGGADDDFMDGDGEADSLAGGAGDDTLDGGTGADTMIGGAGNDTFYVDSLQDVVSTAANATGGTDTVITSVDWTLGTGTEHLTLNLGASVGQGNGAGNLIGSQSGAADTLSGVGGADTLNGGDGADHLFGGSGADRFRIDFAGHSTLQQMDVVRDFNRAQGDVIDLVWVDANGAAAGNGTFGAPAPLLLGELPAVGQLRYLVQGQSTFLYGYLDTVPGADFALEVRGMGVPQPGDILL